MYVYNIYIYSYIVDTFFDFYKCLQPSVYFWVFFGRYHFRPIQSVERECWGIIIAGSNGWGIY